MNHNAFLEALNSPVPTATLGKWPKGDVRQRWAESPALYSKAFGHTDDLHKFLGGHSGIDIAGAHRTPIVAAHDGFVQNIKTDRITLGGLCMWIQSDTLDLNGVPSCIVTSYAHFDEMTVKLGQRVKQGDLIGYMGNTGFVISGGTAYWGNAPAGKGTHLHFGLYEHILKNGAFVPRWTNPMQNSTDPLPFLSDPTPNDGKADGDFGGGITALKNALQYLKLPKFRSS